MTHNPRSDQPTIVVGASRGLGRGIATSLANAGGEVIAVARSESALLELADLPSVRTEAADATDPGVPGSMIERFRPSTVVVVAGATPVLMALHEQTWETFSVNWHADVRLAFNWLREALLAPLSPGSRMIVISSGAALFGSPLSGGYAGAKATQRFITAYAAEESRRGGLGITFTAILPRLTAATTLGRPAVEAYAARSGKSVEAYLRDAGAPVTPEVAGSAVLELVRADAASILPAYLLTGDGLRPAP
jgi:NAD(P)-dependent dehydrogenase (short-subunit alcohol dehydrogenase family)